MGYGETSEGPITPVLGGDGLDVGTAPLKRKQWHMLPPSLGHFYFLPPGPALRPIY